MTRHGTDGMAWHGREWKGMSVFVWTERKQQRCCYDCHGGQFICFLGNDSVALESPTHIRADRHSHD